MGGPPWSTRFAFEPQGFPDARHHPAFPTTVLHKGEDYTAVIRYRFRVSRNDGDSGA
jgi:galactose mutarotase-like enzyme